MSYCVVLRYLIPDTLRFLNSVCLYHVCTQRSRFLSHKILFLCLSADRPCHILRLPGDGLWNLQEEDVTFLLPRYCIFLFKSNFHFICWLLHPLGSKHVTQASRGISSVGSWTGTRPERICIIFWSRTEGAERLKHDKDFIILGDTTMN